MDIAWERLAFSPESDWGCCLVAFLQRIYARRGAESSLVHYRQALMLFFSAPAKSPEMYTRQDVEVFLSLPGKGHGRIGRPVGPGTMNNRLSILNSFYRYATAYTVAGRDGPEPLMKRIPPTVGLSYMQRPQNYRTFSYEDFKRLWSVIPMDAMGLRDRAIFLFLFWTARRRAEICNLRWGDLYQTTIIEHGSQRTVWMYTFSGKGHARQKDHAELPQPAKDALDKYLIAIGRMGHMEADDALFCTVPGYIGQRGYDPKRPLSPQTVWNILKRYLRKAGLDPTITIHSFRHMAAQQRYLAGSDIREIQRLLRHQSLATTDIYLRGLTGTTDLAAKLLEEKFGKF